MFETAKRLDSYRQRSQDRAEVIEHSSGMVIVLADGAGGTSGGAEAADTMIMWAKALASREKHLDDKDAWCELLWQVDHQVNASGGGQTTGVVAAVFPDGIVGASVGDSAAWIIRPDGHTDLTAEQVRKPLLGSGHARPVGFDVAPLDGTLLAASDGLVKYAPRSQIRAAALERNIEIAARKLVDLARLRSGALQDDVAVVLCRPRS